MLRRRTVRYPKRLAVSICSVIFSIGVRANAFDEQIALGGGLGIGRYDQAKKVGPLGSLYGVYGLSDSFDARLELSTSLLLPDASTERALLNSALGYFTYKLDVIQWIPWGGLGLGIHQLGGELPGPKRDDFELGISALLGFDYAWSRNDGVSLAVGLHALPLTEDGSALGVRYVSAALRYEHRWGW